MLVVTTLATTTSMAFNSQRLMPAGLTDVTGSMLTDRGMLVFAVVGVDIVARHVMNDGGRTTVAVALFCLSFLLELHGGAISFSA